MAHELRYDVQSRSVLHAARFTSDYLSIYKMRFVLVLVAATADTGIGKRGSGLLSLHFQGVPGSQPAYDSVIRRSGPKITILLACCFHRIA